MKDRYAKLVGEHNRLFADFNENLQEQVLGFTRDLIECFNSGHKFLLLGNGGSSADAQHFSAELMGRFKKERPSLPAYALTTNSSLLTALSNDYDFTQVFSRQLLGIVKKGDLVLGISTSGNAENVIEAFKAAKQQGASTCLLTGSKGGRAGKIADRAILIPSDNTPRIQEAHIFVIHTVCELLEEEMFGERI